MNEIETKNLHEESGALDLLKVIQSATAKAFSKHGMLPMTAFLITQKDPESGTWVGEDPQVRAVAPKDAETVKDAMQFSAVIDKAARDTMAIGVLQAFESLMTEIVQGPTGSDELNELFGEDFEHVTEGEPHEETKEVVVLAYEHLAFNPMVRLWAAPIERKDGKRVLGEWFEATGSGVSDSPLLGHLTFYD